MSELRVIEVPDPNAPAPDAPPCGVVQITKEFLFGGRAYFGVTNPMGKRLGFILKARSGRRGSPWAGEVSYFLGVYTLNRDDYKFIGVVDPQTGAIKVVGSSKFAAGQPEFDAAQWALNTVFNNDVIAEGYSITHNGKCGKCGKSLVTAGDFASGFHLDCA